MSFRSVIYIVCVPIGFVLLFWLVSLSNPTPPKKKTMPNLNEIAQHMRKQANSEVRTDDVSVVGKTLIIKYTLLNYSNSELPIETQDKQEVSLKNSMCKLMLRNPVKLSEMKEEKIGFNFEYYNFIGVLLQTIKLQADECVSN